MVRLYEIASWPKKTKANIEDIKNKVIDHVTNKDINEDIILAGQFLPRKLSRDERFVDLYGRGVVMAFKNMEFFQAPYGNKIPKATKRAAGFLSDDHKQEAAETFLDQLKNYYPYARHMFIDIAYDWMKEDTKDILIKKAYWYMSDAQKDDMLNTTNIEDLPHDIKMKVKETDLYLLRHFQNTGENKRGLLKRIANSKTLMDKLDFDLYVSREDIEDLPPITRFNFLKRVFNHKILALYPHGAEVSQIMSLTRAYCYSAQNPMRVEPLSKQDVRNILVAVGIKRTHEVEEWIAKYDQYIDNKEYLKGVLENILKNM